MNQYLTEVMSRLSIGGLIAILALLIVMFTIASIRSNRNSPTQSNKAGIPCPMCGKGKQS